MFAAIAATAPGRATYCQLSDEDLPDGDVTVAVRYSSLNYKDGLAVTGKGKIIRKYPMVCGIDLAGTVVESQSADWHIDDDVVVTGFGLSETVPGGYTQRQRVRSEWLIRRPDTLTLHQTMAIGTAGLTAMLCVVALEDAGLTPDGDCDVLVTGAGGGVGSIAVAVLAQLGYEVTASTGRLGTHDFLRSLGASSIINREELAVPCRPLEAEHWRAAIDTVGSQTLATVLAQTRYRGAVAACGLAGGSDLPTTVLPHILRNVALLGIDSVQCPMPARKRAWSRVGTDLPTSLLDEMTTVEPMSRVTQLADKILAGQTRGRVVIDTSG